MLNLVPAGLMVGIAVGLVFVTNRRIADARGAVPTSTRSQAADVAWQVLFLVGLLAGGAFLSFLDPAALPAGQAVPLQLTVGAGLVAGFGARRALASLSGNTDRRPSPLFRRSRLAGCGFTLAGAVGRWMGRNVSGLSPQDSREESDPGYFTLTKT